MDPLIVASIIIGYLAIGFVIGTLVGKIMSDPAWPMEWEEYIVVGAACVFWPLALIVLFFFAVGYSLSSKKRGD